ncbi:hypothetical protein B0H13DRAFT_1873558 [Mycena leptocephala]|nr:hypothetical protein B0H13DRAFT_1873558 [Mycena leptocephala]
MSSLALPIALLSPTIKVLSAPDKWNMGNYLGYLVHVPLNETIKYGGDCWMEETTQKAGKLDELQEQSNTQKYNTTASGRYVFAAATSPPDCARRTIPLIHSENGTVARVAAGNSGLADEDTTLRRGSQICGIAEICGALCIFLKSLSQKGKVSEGSCKPQHSTAEGEANANILGIEEEEEEEEEISYCKVFRYLTIF